MAGGWVIRSGSVKREGDDALFASTRALAGGVFDATRLEPGGAPHRSGDAAEVRAGDVLVALRGPTNGAAVVERTPPLPLFATLDLAVIRTGEAVDATYLAWFINLATTQAALASERVSGGVPRLPLSALQDLDPALPPLDVQRRIARAATLGRAERALAHRLIRLRAETLDAALQVAAARHAVQSGGPPCTP